MAPSPNGPDPCRASGSSKTGNTGTNALLLSIRVGSTTIEAPRLFDDSLYFVGEKALTSIDPAAAVWCRAAVARFPVADATSKQPVVPLTRIAELIAK